MRIIKPGLVALALAAAAIVPTWPAALAAGAGSAVHAAAGSDATGGTWGDAQPLATPHGEIALGTPGVTAISCPAAGECSAVASVAGSPDHSPPIEGVTVAETDGRWRAEEAVPGLATINTGGDAGANAISCSAPGDCGAGGSYAYDSNGVQVSDAFVVSEQDGTWNIARPITYIAGSDPIEDSAVTSISCPSAGNCTAAGPYLAGGKWNDFIVSESDGLWGQAEAVPGLAALSTTHADTTRVAAISCPVAGSCAIDGTYSTTAGEAGWIAEEASGSWTPAAPLPGLGLPTSLSCPSAGSCTAFGSSSSGHSDGTLPIVASEVSGVWGAAQEIPGIAGLGGSAAYGLALSCPSAGNCTAAGNVQVADSYDQTVFVATETDGAWGDASLVAGLGGLSALSCGAPGYCAIGGDAGLIANEVAGTWSAGAIVPGLKGAGFAEIGAISCPAAGYCSAGGLTDNDNPQGNAFVANEATASSVTLAASVSRITYGNEGAERISVTASSPDGGTPAGTVTVASGSVTPCTITLKSGTGTCTLPATSLSGGTHRLIASYNGSADYVGSQSAVTTISVSPSASATSLQLSRASVAYGQERHERLAVLVKLASGARPTGTVVVTSGRFTLCTISLRSGRGSCRLKGGELKKGSYRIRAAYRGNADATPSASAREKLRITP
jgi:hypothetical protein